MFKKKRISPSAFRELRRVEPLRQVEMAELMIAANNCSASYAKCLYTATLDDQKLPSEAPPESHGVPAQDAARMQRECPRCTGKSKLIEESHGENMLHVVPAVGYWKKLLARPRIERYLRAHHIEIAVELRKIVDEPEPGRWQRKSRMSEAGRPSGEDLGSRARLSVSS